MTDRNEKVDKIQTDSIKKSLATAKKDLRLVLDKIENIGFSVRAFRLWRAYSQLRPFKIKFRAPRFWILWICSIFGWILYYSINNYISSIKYDRVSPRVKIRMNCFIFY